MSFTGATERRYTGENMTNIDCTAAIKADPTTSEAVALAAWDRWSASLGFQRVTLNAAFRFVPFLTGAEFQALRVWGMLGSGEPLSDGTPTFRLYA